MFSKDLITPFGLQTILRTWLTNDGLELTENAAEVKLGNYTAYYAERFGKLYLIDLDSNGWDTDVLKELLNKIGLNELPVKTLVIYGYSFSFKNLRELKTNLDTRDKEKKPALQERY
ncbi:MAG: hypothetical protein LBT89_08305 [Planctomycetaceae bacterium]|nr:hypothetical protein [Planctomycetaceae bacterium]